MPARQVFILYDASMGSVSSSSRYSYSNGRFSQSSSGAWVDLYSAWGVSFDKTSLSNLMAPAPLKDMIENSVATEHGKRVVRTGRKYEERTLTLGFNIFAASESAFFTKYGNFCTQVLANGRLDLMTSFQPGVVYRLDYLSCQSFGEYCRQLGKFVLRVVEPNPGNRSVS